MGSPGLNPHQVVMSNELACPPSLYNNYTHYGNVGQLCGNFGALYGSPSYSTPFNPRYNTLYNTPYNTSLNTPYTSHNTLHNTPYVPYTPYNTSYSNSYNTSNNTPYNTSYSNLGYPNGSFPFIEESAPVDSSGPFTPMRSIAGGGETNASGSRYGVRSETPEELASPQVNGNDEQNTMKEEISKNFRQVMEAVWRVGQDNTELQERVARLEAGNPAKRSLRERRSRP